LSGVYKKEKEKLSHMIDELDLKAKKSPLSAAERVAKKQADDCLSRLRRVGSMR
jgi:GH35 family endo-1,4-beta-xylanase